MTIMACLVLILSVIILMISYGIGPFAHEPWFQTHIRFKQLSSKLQSAIQILAFLLSIICSLQIIGIFP